MIPRSAKGVLESIREPSGLPGSASGGPRSASGSPGGAPKLLWTSPGSASDHPWSPRSTRALPRATLDPFCVDLRLIGGGLSDDFCFDLLFVCPFIRAYVRPFVRPFVRSNHSLNHISLLHYLCAIPRPSYFSYSVSPSDRPSTLRTLSSCTSYE